MPGIVLRHRTFLGAVSWFVGLAVIALYVFAVRGDFVLLDYRVYEAGAQDLLNGSLYRAELVSPGVIPLDRFNYPPLAALIAVPFAPLGGVAWIAVGVIGLALGWILLARMLGWHPGWAGVAFAAWLIAPWGSTILVGNVNPMMFALVMGFATLHLSGRQRWAGILLAVVVGIKLWPLTFVPLLVRERRWTTLIWAGGALALQAVLTLAWLGLDVVGPMLADLTYRVPLLEGHFVLNSWPPIVGYAFAAVALLVPARGMAGLGLAMLGGMGLIPNLWNHYTPIIIAGLLLIARRSRWQSESRSPLVSQPSQAARSSG